MRKRILLASLVLALAWVSFASAQEAPATPSRAASATGTKLGIVPSRERAAAAAPAFRFRTPNLSYHGGPVLHTNTAFAIYWIPTGNNPVTGQPYQVSANYKTITNGFFGNVATVSHTTSRTSNVYYSDTQYYDGSGYIADNATFGGAYVDTDPITSDCVDPDTTVCVSDGQLQSELTSVLASLSARGLSSSWAPASNKIYFIFTPKDVGSCFDSSTCSFTYFCAYHSSFNLSVGGTTQTVYYANQPYASFVPSACDAGQHPNNDDADATLNVVSHEHNETITDAQGNAWYDSSGNENGDKCAWNFGTALGRAANGALYNQSINGARYYLQQEWSNRSNRCVLTGT